MLRSRVCAAHMGVFLGPKSIKKGPFFRRFSLNMGRFSISWKKLSNMGSFPPKFIVKVGITVTVGNYKEGSFLKAKCQTLAHPQVMYPPPPGLIMSFPVIPS